MAAILTAPAVHLGGLAASYGDPETDLHTIYLFAVRYGDLESIANLNDALAQAANLNLEERRKAREKAIYDAAFEASENAPDEAVDEVWALMESISPYPDPNFDNPSPHAIEALKRVDENIRAGRTIQGDW